MRAFGSGLLAALVLLATSCSDQPALEPALLIEPGGAARTLRVGTHEQLRINASAVVWSSSDTSIARINDRGELRIAPTYSVCNWVMPGECSVEITARAGTRVAKQRITVIPFEPTMEIDSMQLDLAMGDTARITVRIVVENVAVSWCPVSFATRDSMVAQVDRESGMVVAGDSGTTTIEVNASGPLCPSVPAHVVINTRSRLHVLTIEPVQELILAPGASAQLTAIVRNWKGVTYPALAPRWSSADTAVATVDSAGMVTAKLCLCRTTITARSGRLAATAGVIVRQQN